MNPLGRAQTRDYSSILQFYQARAPYAIRKISVAPKGWRGENRRTAAAGHRTREATMRRLLVVLSVLLVCVSCGQKESDVKAGSAAIKIGLVAPLTGDVKTFGESTRNGFMLAVDEANAAGGVLGRNIEPVIVDDRNDP